MLEIDNSEVLDWKISFDGIFTRKKEFVLWKLDILAAVLLTLKLEVNPISACDLIINFTIVGTSLYNLSWL